MGDGGDQRNVTVTFFVEQIDMWRFPKQLPAKVLASFGWATIAKNWYLTIKTNLI